MGLIRKTLSIATLGIVDFRSQKELVRRADKAQRAAQAELAGVEKARALTDKRLAAAEQRARDAEALALQQAEAAKQGKPKRRDRRRAKRASKKAKRHGDRGEELDDLTGGASGFIDERL